MPRYTLFSKVKVVTDKYNKDNITLGTVGVIMDIYETGDYEVQFLDKEGGPTDVFFAVHEEDIIEMK